MSLPNRSELTRTPYPDAAALRAAPDGAWGVLAALAGATLLVLSTLFVAPALATPTLTLSPAAAVVGVNGSAKFFAVYDADGSGSGLPMYVNPATVWLRSSNRSVLVVDPGTGMIYGEQPGTVTVTAYYKKLVATATVTVAGTLDSLSVVTPSDGRTRTYLLYVPAGYQPGTPIPLVLAYHGGGGNGRALMHQSLLNTIAHAQTFAVAYPDGIGSTQATTSWNAGACCWDAMTEGVDDVGFTRVLIDDIESRLTIDPRRVYATGFSNGAMLAHRLGVEVADRIAAIAPVAAGLAIGGDFVPQPPTRPVSVMQFSGTTDQEVPYTPYIPLTISWWLDRDALPSMSRVLFYQHGIETCQTYQSAFAAATLCTAAPPAKISVNGVLYDGGGHAWPGGIPYSGGDIPTFDIDASASMWAFFSSYPMP
jgi:polyhydroxybutyrate depolymerase